MASIPTGGITIDNLPSASGVNDTDAVIISRSGKAYKTTAIAEQINTLNADLTDVFSTLSDCDISEITKTGVHYIRSSVTGLPNTNGGLYILAYYSPSYQVALFIPRASAGAPYVLINGSVAYQLSTIAVTNLRLEPAEGTDED